MLREEKDAARGLPVTIGLPGERSATIMLTLGHEGRNCTLEKGQVAFRIPIDAHTYLSSKESHNFGAPPGEDLFLLQPNRDYTLQATVAVEGGEAVLWIIEYDGERRLCHQKRSLHTGILGLDWRTHRSHRSCCLAIRLAGTGRLQISDVAIRERIEAPPDPYADERIRVLTSLEEDGLSLGLRLEELRLLLDRGEVERVLVMPEAETCFFDAFDRISMLEKDFPEHVFPMCRFPLSESVNEHQLLFQVRQLELLWQQELIYGVNIQMSAGTAAPASVLDWLERRQVLTFWHVSSEVQREWLSRDVLPHFSFPALSYAGGESELRLENPGQDPPAAGAENLWSLVERVGRHRRKLMREPRDLLFPPLPSTPADLSASGFEVVPPIAFLRSEPQHAKQIWREWKVVSWYRQDKPWAHLLAGLVHDLRPRSVLEFGCNVGRNLAAIGKANPGIRLVGIDVNAQAISRGREACGLDLRCGDEATLLQEDEGAYDLVFTVSVLDHIPDVSRVCAALVRCAGRYLFCLEVTLPVEGRVVHHYDHSRQRVCPSTEASYSWHVDKYVACLPRVRRLDQRPCYLHPAALGPYYRAYLVHLDPVS